MGPPPDPPIWTALLPEEASVAAPSIASPSDHVGFGNVSLRMKFPEAVETLGGEAIPVPGVADGAVSTAPGPQSPGVPGPLGGPEMSMPQAISMRPQERSFR